VIDALVSLRTTVVLLLLIAALLLAALIVPQGTVVGEETVRAIATAHPLQSFVLDTLGLSSVATSPLFIALLAMFYVNLAAVLIDRIPRTLARTRVNVPAEAAVEKWVASPRALSGVAAAPLDRSVAAVLRGHGFRPYRAGSRAWYGVKHRSAAIGFLVFHASFFFLAVGGVMIWYTRFAGETRAVEGQSVTAANARLVRMPKAGGVPKIEFSFDRIVPSFERGEATGLRATVRFGDGRAAESWVNHPARDGAASVLVTDIGIAPVLWLQDSRGFGVDRVAVPADRHEAVDVPLAADVVHVQILPDAGRKDFPSREALQSLPVQIAVRERGREVFRGTLRPGEGAPFPGGRVVLQEVRYWGGLRIVSERGGALLVAGFLLATLGAVWRLLLHRRDVVVSWDGREFRLAGHGEWFADRDRRELMSLCAAFERFTPADERAKEEQVSEVAV
jgi:hypothetical protein